jgi:oligogalacturonide lyase
MPLPITRRTFLKNTSTTLAAGTVASGPMIFATGGSRGRKGRVYPDQRRRYRDARTGHTVWQMTNTPGGTSHAFYFTQAGTTPDGKWLFYGSDRGGPTGKLNLFKMSLGSGESIQLTESENNLWPRWAHPSPDGKEIYYIENYNHFKAVHTETLEERSLGVIENCHRPHQIGVSPDNRALINGIFCENKKEEDFLVGDNFLIRSALVVIDTRTGHRHNLLDGNTPRTHVQHSPTNPNLILYCYGGPWWQVQRMWLIHADGTHNRPIFLQTRFEGAGHEFWADDGRTIFVTCNGGRQPQGLWAVDIDGRNERCVMAGPCVGHGTANAPQDRFVIDDMYGDCKTGLWLAKKGSITPRLLCQTGVDWHAKSQEHHPHPRFLPDGKMVSFTSAMTGNPEVYLVEV